MLVVFQCVTLEGWATIMIFCQKGFSDIIVIYFISLIIIGAFFLINLTLAVIKSKFTDTMGRREQKQTPEQLMLEDLLDAEELKLTESRERIPITNTMELLGQSSARRRKS